MNELRPEHWTAIIVAGLSLIGVLGGGMLAALAGWLKVRADRQLAEANLEAQQAVTKQQIDQQIFTTDQRPKRRSPSRATTTRRSTAPAFAS